MSLNQVSYEVVARKLFWINHPFQLELILVKMVTVSLRNTSPFPCFAILYTEKKKTEIQNSPAVKQAQAQSLSSLQRNTKIYHTGHAS
jgi:hypothetical protein